MSDYTFRTSDFGRWGPGKGSNLTQTEGDLNIWNLLAFITSVSDHLQSSVVSIDYFTVSGTQWTIHLTNGAVLGPYFLPIARRRGTGLWAALHDYLADDTFYINGSSYTVNVPHTSAATFDPDATDGSGHPLYQLELANPGNTVPTGGTILQELVKASGADFDLEWHTRLLSELGDVGILSPQSVGDVLFFDGSIWYNRLPLFSDLSGQIGDAQDIANQSQIVTSSSGTVTVNLGLGRIVYLALTEDVIAFSVTGWAASGIGCTMRLIVTNGASWTMVHPSGMKWASILSPSPPDVSIGAGKVDRYDYFTADSGVTKYGTIAAQDNV